MIESFSGDLVTTELRGYRGWCVTSGGGYLVPVHQRYVEYMGPVTEAGDHQLWVEIAGTISVYSTMNLKTICSCGCKMELSGSQHKSPDPQCRCGIYAFHHPSSIDDDSSIRSAPVKGVVRASGRIIVGTLGFRAERVTIEALHIHLLTHHRVRKYWEEHGVPVFQDIRDMYESFPPISVTALLEERTS